MKTSKLFTAALIAGFMLVGQSVIAQETKQDKSKEKKEMANKINKKADATLKVDETMKADAQPVVVGGAKMFSTRNIIENAVNSKDHTTLVAAVKAADLVEVLSSEGPFTVFAPTNKAFEGLPEGTVESLLKPENKEQLQTVLKYHVVAGNLGSKDIAALIKKNDGKAEITTVAGGTLTAWAKDGSIYISDESGNKAKVNILDVNQSNGVIHVIDAVVLPKS